MLASKNGHPDVVQLLLKHGADVNQTGAENASAIMRASKEGHVEVVELLLKHGADVNQEDSSGITALISAMIGSHRSPDSMNNVVGLLCDSGGNVALKYRDIDLLLYASMQSMLSDKSLNRLNTDSSLVSNATTYYYGSIHGDIFGSTLAVDVLFESEALCVFSDPAGLEKYWTTAGKRIMSSIGRWPYKYDGITGLLNGRLAFSQKSATIRVIAREMFNRSFKVDRLMLNGEKEYFLSKSPSILGLVFDPIPPRRADLTEEKREYYFVSLGKVFARKNALMETILDLDLI